jgi:hypothetical protein
MHLWEILGFQHWILPVATIKLACPLVNPRKHRLLRVKGYLNLPVGSGKLSLTVNSLTRRNSMHRRIELSRLRTTTICELQDEIEGRIILSSIILCNSSLISCLRDRGIRPKCQHFINKLTVIQHKFNKISGRYLHRQCSSILNVKCCWGHQTAYLIFIQNMKN